MSLLTDQVFVAALRSKAELMAMLPAKDVYNTAIALPEAKAANAPVPYLIVTFDGMQNEDETKDDGYEGGTDKVQISIEIAAKKRPQLGTIATMVRQTVRDYFKNIEDTDELYDEVPEDYTLTAGPVNYDELKPCYWQVLTFQCDTKVIEYEQD